MKILRILSLFLLIASSSYAVEIVDYDFDDQSFGILGHGEHWSMQSSGGVGNTPATKLTVVASGTSGKAMILNLIPYESKEFWVEFDVKIVNPPTGGNKFVKVFGDSSVSSQNNMTWMINYNNGSQYEVSYYMDTICTARLNGGHVGCGDGPTFNTFTSPIDFGDNIWGHYKLWFLRGDEGAGNGAVKIWYNGILRLDVSDMQNNPAGHVGDTEFFERLEFGGYVHSVSYTTPWDLWIDNLYVGTTEKDAPPPVCDSSHLYLCTTEPPCTAAGGYWYNGICNADPEAQTCDINHLNLCTTEPPCTAAGGYWYSGICNADPEIPSGPIHFSGSHPILLP